MRLEAIFNDRIGKHALLEFKRELNPNTMYNKYIAVSNQTDSLNCQRKNFTF